MPIEVVMPSLGLTMTEGTIQTWLKREGERVTKDEPLFLVETDKAVTEVVAPADGVLRGVRVAEGTSVPVQQVVAYLAAVGEVWSPPANGPAEPRQPRRGPVSSPTASLPRSDMAAVPAATGSSRPRVTDRTTVQTIPRYPTPVDGGERERLRWMYRTMLRIRRFDERIVTLFAAGKIAGAVHSYVGEEAVAAGVCANLRPDDFIVSTHRGHGHLLAKGGDMNRMMAELFGRADGYCRGKGGSMHITDVSLGILGANGIVGAGIPIATGAGTAIQLQGGDQVVVCFFGDGAANIGSFNEGLNLAGTWNLPVIFVCENNLYAQFTPMRMHTRVTDLFVRAQGYGMPGVAVDGNDVVAVAAAATTAIARARAGQGPSLIEAKTFRWFGHAINNPASAIGRDEDEIARWKARDPIPSFEERLLRDGVAIRADLDAMARSVDEELEYAIRFAEASPPPPPEEALDDVYAELPEGAEL